MIINPSSLFAFYVVGFSSFVVEAGVVALLLAFRGAAPLRVFNANAAVSGAPQETATAWQRIQFRSLGNSRRIVARTSPKLSFILPLANLICWRPWMFENSFVPVSSSTMALAKPSRP